jgi:hypothetical protein
LQEQGKQGKNSSVGMAGPVKRDLFCRRLRMIHPTRKWQTMKGFSEEA